jgi:hypothetical protein
MGRSGIDSGQFGYTHPYLKSVKLLLPPSVPHNKDLLGEGWMSPRMEHALLHFAEVGGDSIRDGWANLSYIPDHFKRLT